MAGEEKRRYKNTTTGYVGVIKINPRGEEKGLAVEPGDTVELSREEVEATANAHRSAADSPFEEQDYEVRHIGTGELLESGRRAPLELVTEKRPTPGFESEDGPAQEAAQTEGQAPDGEYAAGEEAGPPLATAQDIRVSDTEA